MTKRLTMALLACAVCAFETMPSMAADAPKSPRVGYKVDDFTLDTLDGQPVSLHKLLAETPIVLVVLRGYPGYQCPICSIQVGDLIKHATEIAAVKARVVLVYPGPADNLGQRATEFLKKRTLPENFILVTDPDYKFVTALGLRWDAPQETAYPSTFVIDRQRTVRLAEISKSHGDRAKTADVIKALPGVD